MRKSNDSSPVHQDLMDTMDLHSFYLVLVTKVEGVHMHLYSFLITTLDGVVSITPRLL